MNANNAAWGPLGTPTKEQIQEWCDMPYGKFTELKKELCRKRKGKFPTTYKIRVCKSDITMNESYADIEVMAFDYKEALNLANKTDFTKLEYSDPAVVRNKVTYMCWLGD